MQCMGMMRLKKLMSYSCIYESSMGFFIAKPFFMEFQEWATRGRFLKSINFCILSGRYVDFFDLNTSEECFGFIF